MLICRAQLWGQRRFTCIWCKITWAGMPSPSCMGFLFKAQGKMWHIGEGKMSLCASTMKRWLSQLWVADALRLQAQAFRDISTLPSRGCIRNTFSEENLLTAEWEEGFVFSPVCFMKYSMCSILPHQHRIVLFHLHYIDTTLCYIIIILFWNDIVTNTTFFKLVFFHLFVIAYRLQANLHSFLHSVFMR